jgi:signal transduction histidine kinase/CheY-like chemotaxis protein/HPt (histidine-containing phosphotransfer) domain-containing protein
VDDTTDAPRRPAPDLTDSGWVALLPDALCVMDAAFNIVSMRPGTVSLDECFHPADHDDISKALEQCRELPGREVTVPARSMDGLNGWRQGVASVVDWTTYPAIAAVVLRWRPTRYSDIGAAVVPEVFRRAMDRSLSGLLIIDPTGHVLYANELAARLCAVSGAKLREQQLADVVGTPAADELTLGRPEPISMTVGGVDAHISSEVVRTEGGDALALLVFIRPAPLLPPPAVLGAHQLVPRFAAVLVDPADGVPGAVHTAVHDVIKTVAGITMLASGAAVAGTTTPPSPAGTPDGLRTLLDRTLTDALPLGIFELDANCRLSWANNAWWELLGAFASHEPFGWLGKIHPDDQGRIDGVFLRARTGAWFDERYRVRRDVDSWAWVHTRVVAGRDGHAGASIDITVATDGELQLAEARDAAVETSRLKSEFLANMSHEIRTPLNGVIGMATLLLDSPLNRDQRDQVVTLRTAGEHLLGLVNDILDFSKVETGKLELESTEFELLDVIHDVVSLHSSAAFDKGLRLRIDTDASLPRRVTGDQARLRQVLTNLVGNAIKFTEQGSVTIRLTSEGRNSNVVRFEVVDTGAGIAPESLEKIFDPFVQADASTTRRFGGTGLGLPISRRLAEAMGGVLSVDSKLDVGSTFWFTVPFDGPADSTLDANVELDRHRSIDVQIDVQAEPVDEHEPVEAERADEQAPPTALVAAADGTVAKRIPGTRGRVLVVEDNPINQKVAIGFLTHLGWEVDVAGDGLQGVEAATSSEYDVILMDCQMPRMDGYEATARIRARQGSERRIPIIALTAAAMPGDRQRCVDAGMDDYLSKPVDIARLDQILTEWTTGQGAASAETPGDIDLNRQLEPLPDEQFDPQVDEHVEHPASDEYTFSDGDAFSDEYVDDVLDPIVVAQLRFVPMETGTLFDEAVRQFRSAAAESMSTAATATAAQQWTTVAQVAHTLKGMAATVGASALAEAARALEVAAGHDEPDLWLTDRLLVEIRSELGRALAAIERLPAAT